jgi:methylglutaconyl-CoA hydratase
MTRFETIEVSLARRVATVRLNRPKVRNAFNETMISELTRAFADLGTNDAVRAVVLAANGPVFSAGADLDWMRRMSAFSHEENLADARRLAQMLRTIYECEKPCIACVHGDAYAGGMGLVAACDVTIASTQAEFCLTEVRLGLVPATIAPYVIRAMGEQHARRYFITAEKFGAAEAHRIGLVHELAAPADLDAAVGRTLAALMAASPAAVSESKRLLREIAGRGVDDELLADTAQRIARLRASDDGREGVRSFLDKRKPRWLAQYEAEALRDAPDDDEQM